MLRVITENYEGNSKFFIAQITEALLLALTILILLF